MRKQTMIIFSSQRTDKTPRENKLAFDRATAYLSSLGVPYKVGTGVYKSEIEPCFIVPTNMGTIELVKQYALEQLDQECVLVQHGDGLSRLEYSNDRSEVIGRLKMVDREEAFNSVAYTTLGNNFYLAK